MNNIKQLLKTDRPVFIMVTISLLIAFFLVIYMLFSINPQTTQIDARFNTLLKFHGRTNWQFLYVVPGMLFVLSLVEALVAMHEGLSSNIKKVFIILVTTLSLFACYIFVQMISVVGA